MTVSVFIVDDHELLRLGLREALDAEVDIQVVGEAGRVEDSVELVLEARPDVALLDVRLPDGSGIELCRDILARDHEIRCLMFTSAAEDEPLYDAVLAGASGYVLKDSPRSDLVAAIRRVAAGDSLIDPAMTDRILTRMRSESEGPAADLTRQERNILDLIGEGLTNKEIAERLNLAEQTTKNYVSRVLTKLDMGRTRAALYSAGLLRDRRDRDK